MTSELYKNIVIKQQLAQMPLSMNPPKHVPEMLYIGCIDARLDPVADIGIPHGKALIYRNIGALVMKETQQARQKLNKEEILAAGEIPENVSMGAALEFFIKHLKASLDKDGKPKIKDIVVSGHTNCGGIAACHDHEDIKDDVYLPHYLSTLDGVRDKVMADPNLRTREERLHALEEASVRQSITNLRSYKVVRDAEKAGLVHLHGWVIDTATQRIMELDEQGHFHSMNEHHKKSPSR